MVSHMTLLHKKSYGDFCIKCEKSQEKTGLRGLRSSRTEATY